MNSHNDFLIALGELEGFIDRHKFDHLLIAGDFNVDFNRESTNLHHLHNFLSDLNLVVADLSFLSSIHFTYRRDDGCVTSWPDHFLCDSSLCSDLSAFGCSDFGANLSDHLPLSCSLRVNISSSPPPPLPAPTVKFRIAWHAATPDQFVSYCNMVSSHLLPFPVSIRDCCDPFCTQHCPALDSLSDQLIKCLHDSALSSLPRVHRSSTTSGWNMNTRLLKEKANFWHDVWRQAGSPSSGVLHQIRRSTKSRFKYEVRCLRRREQFIRREKMAAALASADSKSFWQQVHRVNKSKSSIPASSVDGVSGADHISLLFSNKLRGILNSQHACGMTHFSLPSLRS